MTLTDQGKFLWVQIRRRTRPARPLLLSGRRTFTWLRVALPGSVAAVVLCAQGGSPPPQQIYQDAEAAITAERWAEAADGYLKLASLNPEVAEIHAKVGWIYYQMGRFQDAVPPFQHALKKKPGLANAEVLLAVSLSELGRFKESVPMLEKHFPKPPDTGLKRIIGLELQRGYLGLERFEDAAEQALKIIRLYPDDAEIIYYTGRLFGDFSFISMQRLRKEAPDSVWKHLATAEAFESQRNHELAIVEYRRVLELEPDRAGVHVRIGRIMRYDLQPRPAVEEIQQAFRRELEIDPTSATAAFELGEVLRVQGRVEEAHKYLGLAVELYPDYEQARVALARALMQIKQPGEARLQLEAAIRLEPGNETSHYLLSQVYQTLGDIEGRKRELAEFERLRTGGANR